MEVGDIVELWTVKGKYKVRILDFPDEQTAHVVGEHVEQPYPLCLVEHVWKCNLH